MIFHPYQKNIKNLTLILRINSWCHYWNGRKIKLFGVTLDEYTNCKPHTNKLSHLNCLILAWGYQCGHLEKNKKTSSHNNTDPLFKQELLKLADLVTLNKVEFYYKYSDMLLLEYLLDFNITNQGTHHTLNTWAPFY